MLDNMDTQGGRDEGRDREAMQERPVTDRPVADREVPLDAHASADAKETINLWLDGEVSEAAARRADARQVEFWASVNAQTEQRRRMTTPSHVTEAIMAAIPEKNADRAQTAATSQADARMSLTPISAAAAAAGFTALGVLIGRVIGR